MLGPGTKARLGSWLWPEGRSPHGLKAIPMIIAIASGKGGTGKTTVAINLVLSIPDAQYLDCDVEEPNGHLFLHPDLQARYPVTVPLPQIDHTICTLCGRCAEACEFNALAVSKQRVLIFPELCHGCGVCRFVCPEPGAITEIERRIGEVVVGQARHKNGAAIAFAQGTLDVGEAVAVPVIKAVKRYADTRRTVILDAAPGTACPMVQTVREADYCLLVTEPTPFGLNDLRLAWPALWWAWTSASSSNSRIESRGRA